MSVLVNLTNFTGLISDATKVPVILDASSAVLVRL